MSTSFDFRRLRAQHQQRNGIKHGWPSNDDYTRLAHVVDFPGLTFDLGLQRFSRLYHCLRRAAMRLTAEDFIMEATRDPETHARTGYRVHVASAVTAVRLRICLQQAARGLPLPLDGWRS